MSVKETYASTLYELEQIRQIHERQAESTQVRSLSNLHTLAGLISWAVNEPKHMPSLQSLLPKKMRKPPDLSKMKKEAAALGIRVP